MIFHVVEMTALGSDRLASQAILHDSFGEFDRGEIFTQQIFGDRPVVHARLHKLASDDGHERAKDANEKIATQLGNHMRFGTPEEAATRILELCARLERRVAALEEEGRP